MKRKDFNKFLDRDLGCIHCGELERIAPHHRRNRGMGGSRLLNNPANIIVLCSFINSGIESDAKLAEMARRLGWKLSPGQDPLKVSVWYPKYEAWYRLDDKFNLILVSNSPVTAVEKLGF